MWNQKRQRHNHWLRNINRKRAISYTKHEKAIAWYANLLKRKNEEGDTKWIRKTLPKAEQKLKKYWITNRMLEQYFERKWLKDLLSNKN